MLINSNAYERRCSDHNNIIPFSGGNLWIFLEFLPLVSLYDLLVFEAPVSAGLSSTADIGRIRDLCTVCERFVEVPIYIYIRYSDTSTVVVYTET